MANPRMVIDTSIFIEFLRAKNKKETTLLKLPDDSEIFISAVTYYELLMGAKDENKKKDIALLTDSLPILPFSSVVAKKASEIYHQLRLNNQMIEFRDIFIAATAIENELPILTLNENTLTELRN